MRDTRVMRTDPNSWWPDEQVTAGREHFDEQHARRYDAKMDAGADEEVRLLQSLGALTRVSTVVDFGAGTGQFTLAVAPHCRRVVAVDVSPVMLGRLEDKLANGAANNVETVSAGFLSYDHTGEPADVAYSRFALHHLPDFWKALALSRIASALKSGGVLRLSDVVYSFEPAEAEQVIEAWIAETVGGDVEHEWTRAELAEHVRDENSTFSWLLEPMIDRAGLEITDASYSTSRMLASYICVKR